MGTDRTRGNAAGAAEFQALTRGEGMTKPSASRKSRIKNLSAKTVANKKAKSVRGGALASYLVLKGQKQGDIKEGSTK